VGELHAAADAAIKIEIITTPQITNGKNTFFMLKPLNQCISDYFNQVTYKILSAFFEIKKKLKTKFLFLKKSRSEKINFISVLVLASQR
jgi:hypothetical protein